MIRFRKYRLMLVVTIVILLGNNGYGETINHDTCLLTLDKTIQSVLLAPPDKYNPGQIDKLITLTSCFNSLKLPTISITLLTDSRFKPEPALLTSQQKIAVFQNMAQAYRQIQDYNHAEEFYKKILEHYSNQNNQDSVLAISFTLTDMLLDENNTEKASLYLLLIHKIIDSKPSAFNLRCKLLLHEAKAARLQHNYHRAIYLHRLAIDSSASCHKAENIQHRLRLASLYNLVSNIDSSALMFKSIGKDSVLFLPDYYLAKSALFRKKKDFVSASYYFGLFVNETNQQNKITDNYRLKMLSVNQGFIKFIATLKPIEKENFFSWGLSLLGIIFSLIVLTILILIILSQRKQLAKRKEDLLKAESVKNKLLADGKKLTERENDGVNTRRDLIAKEITEINQSIENLKQQIEQTKLIKKKRDKVNMEINFQVRSLLSSVIGLSGIFKTDFAKRKDTKLYKYADIIEENASLLLNIIDAYHEYTSIDSGKASYNITKVNAVSIIQDVVNELNDKAKQASAKLIFNNKKTPLLLADESILKKIITIATRVALNNTNRGFVIIDIDLADNGKLCTIKIQNTGHGFDPAYLPDILKPFNREGLNYIPGFTGTGMEYPLINRLAQLIKGKVTINAAIEQGITFTLTLPATDVFESTRTIKPSQAKTKEKNAIPWKGLKVLVVEDDVMNRLLFTKILKAASTLVIAEDGEKALETVGDFFREDEVFDLVLMDINLPQPWDGVKLKDKIRELFMPYKSVPFIAQTAYAMQGDREEFLAKGFDEYISKPIMKKELIRVSAIALKQKTI